MKDQTARVRIPWKAILEKAYDAVLITELEGNRIIEANSLAEKLFEKNRDEILASNLSSFFPPEDIPLILQNSETSSKEMENPLIRTTIVSASGKKVPVEVGRRLIELNNHSYAVDFFRDVSAWVEAEAKLKLNEAMLKESEEKYRLLFESNVVGVCISDHDGHVHECNQAMATIFGCTREEFLKTNASTLYIKPEDRQIFLEMLDRNGITENFETMLQRKNGEMFWALFSGKVIPYELTDKFIITLIDIDQIKQSMQVLKDSQEALIQLYEDALEISEMKSNFITFASHELKTPLVPIIGWADFMHTILSRGQKLDDVIGMEEINGIVRGCDRLQKIIQDFLDFGRLESKRILLQVQEHNFRDLVKNALEIISQMARTNNIAIVNKTKSIELWVDGFRVEQILINILSNAIKYSPPSTQVTIESRQKGNFLEINIKDQGFGFTPEQLKDIWHPFTTKKAQNKQGFMASTGIGLFLTKGLVEAHQGTIELTSPGPNLGTTVRITLPIKKSIVAE